MSENPQYTPPPPYYNTQPPQQQQQPAAWPLPAARSAAALTLSPLNMLALLIPVGILALIIGAVIDSYNGITTFLMFFGLGSIVIGGMALVAGQALAAMKKKD